MKAVFVALVALVAVSSAGVILPQTYGLGISSPLISPLAYSNFAYPSPLAYSAPFAAAPAIKSGYVAATRGSVHTAPLPEGPFAFSHHINTAPAPGTF